MLLSVSFFRSSLSLKASIPQYVRFTTKNSCVPGSSCERIDRKKPLEEASMLLVRTDSDNVRIIDAVCINCNKRFKSIRAVSMHLKMKGTRHAVNFINYGNYDKKTGLRELNRPEA